MKAKSYPYCIRNIVNKCCIEYVKVLNERDCLVVEIQVENKRDYAKIAEEFSVSYYESEIAEKRVSLITKKEFDINYQHALKLITLKIT